MSKSNIYLSTTVLVCVIALFQSALYADSEFDMFHGQTTYMNNCAVCHGEAGEGDGPMADKLITSPSDLTILSKLNGGSFPETMVYQLIDGRRVVYTDEGPEVESFHGPRDMPIWGDTFRAIEGDEGAVDDVISNLIKYLKSIQNK